MTEQAKFRFEPAPNLPGADRVSRFGNTALRLVVSKLWDVTTTGLDNVPRTGGAIIAANHLSFCDSIFVPAVLPRRIWTIGKGEYMESWKTRHLFPAFGMIPVDRSDGKKARDALDTAARVLTNEHLFLIYPEGTRSRSGDLHRGRTGAARLALRTNTPIIPVGHHGTVQVQPADSTLMRPFRQVRVSFGTPMWAHDHGDPDDPRTKRAFTDAVMYEISTLSGQNYVHTYANAPRKNVGQIATVAPSKPTRPATAAIPTPTTI